MSGHNVNVCDIGDEVKEVLKKFRFQKHTSNSALILKEKTKVLVDHAAKSGVWNTIKNGGNKIAAFWYVHKGNDWDISGFTLHVNREKQILEVDEELDSVELEELQDILPSHQPRFIVYSYKMEHSDGRTSFPMCFIFYTPRDAHMELQVMYAGTQRALAAAVGAPRLLEVREIDELTSEWLNEKLQKYTEKGVISRHHHRSHNETTKNK